MEQIIILLLPEVITSETTEIWKRKQRSFEK